MAQMTGAEALVKALRPEQVPFVFGVAGGKLAPFLHALSRENAIRYVGTRHEAAGPLMAAAVAAGGGRMSVAIGEMGPGAANLVGGLGTAYNNSLPLLLITTNQHQAAAYPHRGMFMDLDTQSLLAPLTKWSAVVQDARRIPELVRTAFRQALSGRPGPVHLEFPQNLLAGAVELPDDAFEVSPQRYRVEGGPRPTVEAVAAAAQLLAKAKRPLLVAGGGVVAAGATALFRDIAGLLDAPATSTQMGLGVIPSTSAHFIGHGGIIGGPAILHAFEKADVILAVGCRFSSWLWDERGPLARPHHRIVNINIDPMALGGAVPHEIGMWADARSALDDLLPALRASGVEVARGWREGVRKVYHGYRETLDRIAADDGPVMHPAALARAVADALPADALVAYDGGHTSFWSNDLTPVLDVRTRFHEPGMCQLGFGTPYAIALKLAHPSRPVLNIIGDGAFGFTIQELDTARRNKLPIITIVHNNAAWGIIKAGQRKGFDFTLGADLDGTDYAAIAKGFGCHGAVVTKPEQVKPALQKALRSGLPAVIDCRVRFEPHPAMPAFGRMNAFGAGSAGR